ncbi:MAG: hypothetical protein HC782_02280 [Gammaproteobacteria bacterium]|nr:hypothetical protein [Gammaproteobacteria bacterium]
MNVTTTYYPPTIGRDIAALMQPNTRVIYTESPGSLTFEVQDVPAICAEAKKARCCQFTRQHMATPFFYTALDKGVDMTIMAATKYIVGHSDVMIGSVTLGGVAS